MEEEIIGLWEGVKKETRERVIRCAEALSEREFTAIPVPTISEANRRVISKIPRRINVFCWHSLTLEETGILDTLVARGNKVIDVLPLWKGLKKPHKFGKGDAFVTSACAITSDGIIIKPEPEGFPAFSEAGKPEIAVLIAGVNKIVDGVDEGIRRAKDICIPQFALKFGLNLECAKKGSCVECASPSTLCTVHTLISRKPAGIDFTVVLVGEHIGR